MRSYTLLALHPRREVISEPRSLRALTRGIIGAALISPSHWSPDNALLAPSPFGAVFLGDRACSNRNNSA